MPPDESLTASNPVQQLQPLDDRESCARAWGSGPLETQDCDIAFVCGVCRLPERWTNNLKIFRIFALLLIYFQTSADNEGSLRRRRSQGGTLRQGILHLRAEEREAVLQVPYVPKFPEKSRYSIAFVTNTAVGNNISPECSWENYFSVPSEIMTHSALHGLKMGYFKWMPKQNMGIKTFYFIFS